MSSKGNENLSIFYDFFQRIPIFEKNLNMLYGVSYIPEKLIPWLSKWAWFHSSYTKFKVHYQCFLQLPRNWTQIWQSVIYDKVSDQGSIWRQWDFLHESCYPQQVWVEGIIFSQKEKNAAEVMIFPLPQFFLAIKWPWLLKLLADNMLNIVIKRKR